MTSGGATNLAAPAGGGTLVSRHATVLVVDDDQWMREVVARALRDGGYDVLEACDGQAALSVSAGHEGVIDLVCSDAVMPGMNGATVVSNLRRFRPALKAVFMSGYSGEDLTTWGVDASREAFIRKPFTGHELVATIRTHLASTPTATAGDPDGVDGLDALIANAARLSVLHDTGLLDAAPDERFGRLTRLAARFLRVPTALLVLVDAHRDFYLSSVGLDQAVASSRTVRGRTLSHHALRSPAPLLIEDVANDAVLARVPTVERFGIGAYLGIPIIVEGQPIGMLSVVSPRPRKWWPDEVRVLRDLADIALDEIALRMAVRRDRNAHEALGHANRQLHLAKQTAEAASRAKSEFLAHMSHELRTPLNSIIGFANLLRRNGAGSLSARETTYAERIQVNGARLLAVVDGILDLSKVEQGDLTLRLSRVQLVDLVRAVCGDHTAAGLAAGRSLTVAVEGLAHAGGLPALLHTDETKLRQILANLVGNALKFTPAGGAVRVVLACDARSSAPLQLAVHDNGIGIAPEAQARVFDAFEQGEADTNARFGGVGLGLRIARALCDALGYALTLESTPGVGSTFSVSLVRPAA